MGSSKEDDRAAFLGVFRELADGLVQDEVDDDQVTIAVAWIKRMIEYNVPHGKLNRGLAVVDGVRALKAAKGEEVSEDEMKRAMVVGWCIEFLQAYFLVADDIMDESVTRRGQPCWYRQPDVKMTVMGLWHAVEAVGFYGGAKEVLCGSTKQSSPQPPRGSVVACALGDVCCPLPSTHAVGGVGRWEGRPHHARRPEQAE